MKMFIQLKLDDSSYAIDYIEAIVYTIYDMACMDDIEWYDSFPYIYLDANNKNTKQLLQRLATLGWLDDEVVDTGEIVPYN